MNQFAKRYIPVTLIAVATVLAPAFALAQEPPLDIDATAVSLGGISQPSGTVQITIHIERWSTPEDTARLRDAVVEKGGDALLRALTKAKPVGNISTAGRVGWDIHYASVTKLASGGRKIVFGTDRPMSFAERSNSTRSSEYEYLVGEVRVGPDGKGQGTLVPRAMVMYDDENKTVTIENYDTQPVRLTNVRVQGRK